MISRYNTRMKLITSNIRFDNPSDGLNSWDHRREFLSSLLLSHSPHIIGTQEGKRNQLYDLLSLLKGYKLVDQHRSWIEERMYPSFFFDEKKLKLLDSYDVWLSKTPTIAGSSDFSSAFPRLMTAAHFLELSSQETFWVFNVHLDHILESTRESQATVMIDEIKKLSPKSFILMGDFNQKAQTSLYHRIIADLELYDPWEKAEETSYHSFHPSDISGGRIDWIFLTKNFKAASINLDKTHRDDQYPSDHYPVVCELKP